LCGSAIFHFQIKKKKPDAEIGYITFLRLHSEVTAAPRHIRLLEVFSSSPHKENNNNPIDLKGHREDKMRQCCESILITEHYVNVICNHYYYLPTIHILSSLKFSCFLHPQSISLVCSVGLKLREK
jgi:hypothetical protein